LLIPVRELSNISIKDFTLIAKDQMKFINEDELHEENEVLEETEDDKDEHDNKLQQRSAQIMRGNHDKIDLLIE
jgi:hypothetical protein